MTVFLTTQYLEEADVLADRVGIIDHGRIVAEGTPAQLKAEIAPTDRRGAPARARATKGASPRCSSASASRRPAPDGAVAVRLEHGEEELADIVRALDAEGLRVARINAPRADARRRLPRQDRPLARGRGSEEEQRAASRSRP